MLNAELLRKLAVITPEEQRALCGDKTIDRALYMENENNVISGKKMLQNGKQITIRPHTRFVHFPEHSRDYVEIVYMCSGTTTHIVNGEKIVLREGELLFLCQSARQEILPAGEKDIAVNFMIMPTFFDGILHMLGEEDTPLRHFIIACLTSRHKEIGYLYFKVADVLPIQNLLENMIWAQIYETPDKRNINGISVGLLFLHLMHFTDRLASPGGEEQAVVKALRYIEENYKNGSLARLSKKLHYDECALSREIKQRTGKTYTALVQEKRLSRACYLLKNTPLTIEEIAEHVGYENLSFFYRLFKKQYAMNPKAYREA